MCGIVGYVGEKIQTKNIVKILQKLEYRGYDSSGICSFEQGFNITKRTGFISNLMSAVPENSETECAIAHTRWATHGEVTEQNAHPHVSNGGVWSIVHNGIIENFKEINNTLISKPQSTTDTATLCEYLEECGADDIVSFANVLKNVKGSYAIAGQNKNYPKCLFLAKKKSPLYVAQSNVGVLVASDPACFEGYCSEFYIMKDDEFCFINDKNISFYDQNLQLIEKNKNTLSVSDSSGDSLNYPHFMLKEIMEQPYALKNLAEHYCSYDILNQFDREFFDSFNKVVFVGCGTAYHTSLLGAKMMSKLTGKYATAEIASEFIYSQPVFADKNTLFVFVSQSGETADTLCAFEIAKSFGSKTIAITNVMHSTLASKTDYVLPVCAGREVAVASTKAYVCQLAVEYLFATHFANLIKNKCVNNIEKIKTVSSKILQFDFEKIENLGNKIKDQKDVIFIGKNSDYVSASEGALKLKEVSYISASSYPSGELKHGFLAMVQKDTPLVVFAGSKETASKTFNSAHEAISRGANEIVITNQNNSPFENTIYIDEPDEFLFAILSIVPLQYLAYQTSIAKGINPDKPRNLAKSVTVE